jgi:opacity protein-like surface antigen
MLSARLRISILIATASLTAGAAQAADYSPPQCYDAAFIASGRAPYGAVPCYVPPPVIEEFSSWYLRGDIGFTNQSVRDVTNIQDASNSVQNKGMGFDASPLFGLGIGYYFNDWLRFDLTGEYRSKANFHGTQVITSGGGTITDEYSGSKSEWLFLLNGYVDLGTWNGFTPFVGAGVGMSRNTISSFRDVCTVCGTTGSVAFGDDQSKWNFAWALHAGVGYKVSKNFTIELAYRYVDLGNAQSGDLYDYFGTNNINNPMEFNHLTSHDIKLGLRFNFDGFGSSSSSYYAPAPVVYQPQVYQPAPVYAPPPVYVQPPLRSRG